MSFESKLFTMLNEPIDVVLGDRRALTATARGDVVLEMLLPNGQSKSCTLHEVLYVPKLSYNLISVAKASRKGKTIKFTTSACYMLDKGHKLIAKATKVGSLYQLDYLPNHERASFAEKADTKEDIWHKRLGHLGVHSLQKLAKEKLVVGFNFDASKDSLSVNRALRVNNTKPSFHQAVGGQKNR